MPQPNAPIVVLVSPPWGTKSRSITVKPPNVSFANNGHGPHFIQTVQLVAPNKPRFANESSCSIMWSSEFYVGAKRLGIYDPPPSLPLLPPPPILQVERIDVAQRKMFRNMCSYRPRPGEPPGDFTVTPTQS